MSTKGQVNAKSPKRPTKATVVPRAGRRDGRHDTSSTKTTPTSPARGSRNAKSTSRVPSRAGSDSSAKSSAKPRTASKPKSTAAGTKVQATAAPATDGAINALHRALFGEWPAPEPTQDIRWIHHPYVVNSLLGLGLVAIVWLVTGSWQCAAAGGICYLAGAYTWFQGKAELS